MSDSTPPPSMNNKYEERDTNVRMVFILIAALMGTLIASIALSAVMHKVFLVAFHRYENHRIMSPMAQMHRMPPEPRLQPDPTIDMVHFREQEDSLVSNYGWVDSQNGRVRIPVSRAMAIIADRGLPARKGGAGQ
jgi:hypothetical protein